VLAFISNQEWYYLPIETPYIAIRYLYTETGWDIRWLYVSINDNSSEQNLLTSFWFAGSAYFAAVGLILDGFNSDTQE
ncbi:MAG: hypothetical protein KDK27_11265, partial [Leptospiraceae bacterium]|nr:hypothetical protein [Leptospiraceae bacterium]